jgi:hypothetical protein
MDPVGSSSHGLAFSVCRRLPLAATVVLLAASTSRPVVSTTSVAPGRHAADVPLSFEANQGQSDSRVKFLARGHGYTLFLTTSETVLFLTPAAHVERGPSQPSHAVVRLRLIDANRNATVEGLDPLPARSHYFVGRDPQRWRTGIPHYARVRLRDVYPGIDQVFHSARGQLEYDLVVAPGADSSRIAVDFDGIDSVRVNQTGDLILTAGGAEIRQHAPEVYQEIDGARRAVAAKYVMRRAHQVGFEIGAYDVARPLVIDPVLVYSTYLSGTGDDVANGIIADAAGNVYLAGMTTSADFPTANARQAFGGQRDVFVAKLDPTGSQLVYSTYLGGTGSDTGYALALDTGGNIYVAGTTLSTYFPTINAVQPAYVSS